MGRVTRRHTVLKLGSDRMSRRSDLLAVEEPLEVRLSGAPFTVTMRTPGSDVEMVHGLLYSEQVIGSAADVVLARYCAGEGSDGLNVSSVSGANTGHRGERGLNTYNVLDVTLAAGVAPPDPGLQRNVLTTSACGICGSTSIDAVTRRARYVLDERFHVPAAVISRGQELLRTQQRVFAQTGGLHAAGLLTATGELSSVREDVGRHNAVDKVIGSALLANRLPLSDSVLCVSGRASFELTQKAVLAGIPVLAAVSAPSSLAVELAESAGLTLVGFVRAGQMNVYTHADRIIARADRAAEPTEDSPAVTA